MPLYFIVTTGPQKGYKLPIKEGLEIGRSKKSGLRLSDPNVSASHAKVVKKENQWILMDNDSLNGTQFNGQSVKSLFLSNGVSFQVGQNTIEVSLEEEKLEAKEVSVIDFLDSESVEFFRKKKQGQKEDWVSVLTRYTNDLESLFENRSESIVFLKTPLCLSFTKGLQVGTSWVLTYGPRKVGRGSVDLPIYEKKAPLLCFEVVILSEEAHLTSKEFKNVLFNGKPFSSEKVKSGDVVDIENTCIQFHLC